MLVDSFQDTQLNDYRLCYWYKITHDTFMSFLYTWPNPAGSFRVNRTWNCSIQEILILLILDWQTSLAWGLSPCFGVPVFQKILTTRLWRYSPHGFGKSEIFIQHNSLIMQISNALTQAHPQTQTLLITIFANNGNHWAMLVKLLSYIYNIHASKSHWIMLYSASWLTVSKTHRIVWLTLNINTVKLPHT